MSKSLKQWKNASSLIIAARRPQRRISPVLSNLDRSCDYSLLFLKRQEKTAFANAHVFPGGVIDSSDFSLKWMDVFKRVGISNVNDFALPDLTDKPRPWPLQSGSSEDSHLPSDVAFRICALRETFEESGLLLLSENVENSSMASCYHGDLSTRDLREWQRKVHNDGSLFLNLCLELNAVPNIWSMTEWFHILTPQHLKKRYDTMFYLCTMDGDPPEVQIDDVEMVQREWSTPSEILESFFNGKTTLSPPQIFLAAVLLNFPKMQELHEYAIARQLQGLESTMPVVLKAEDGHMTVMPGDDCYPRTVTLESKEKMEELDETLEENKAKSRNLHRIMFHDSKEITLDCNVDLKCGVLRPLSISKSTWKS